MSRRSRPAHAVGLALVIAAGLASRSRLASVLPEFVAAYAGDTLWALALFLVLGLAFPARPTWQLAVAALAGSFAVEFSQLWRSGWLDAIRATRVGALLLGSGFLASDLACYTVGVGLGAAGERLADRARRPGCSGHRRPARPDT